METETYIMQENTAGNIPVHPADEAFSGGHTFLHDTTVGIPDNLPAAPVRDSMFMSTLTVAFTLIGILMIKKFVRFFPSMIGCLVRVKEVYNLEDSMKLSRDRNALGLFFIIPFCIAALGLNLWEFHSPKISTPEIKFLMIVVIFAGYILLRYILHSIAVPSQMGQKERQISRGLTCTFFISITVMVSLMASINAFSNVDPAIMKTVTLYLMLLIYMVYLIRKLQIFSMSCHVLTAILYLCALEILPTGLLIASAIVL